jgi:hypothetical protein
MSSNRFNRRSYDSVAVCFTAVVAILVFAFFALAATSAHAETPSPPASPAASVPPPPPASSETSGVDTSMCSAPELTQAFLFAQDINLYTLIPGESFDSFTGEGWELSGGAQVGQASLYDGGEGGILDLPAGSSAVSPTICVTSAYPFARTMIRSLSATEAVQFYVSYEGTKTWSTPKAVGKAVGNKNGSWTASAPIRLQPEKTEGWQRLRIILAGAKAGESQLYNLYVDPRMGG